MKGSHCLPERLFWTSVITPSLSCVTGERALSYMQCCHWVYMIWADRIWRAWTSNLSFRGYCVLIIVFLLLAFLKIHRTGCIKSLLRFLGNLRTYMATNPKNWGRSKDMHLYSVNFNPLSLKITWVCRFRTQHLHKSHCYVLEETCSFRDLRVGLQKRRFFLCNYYFSWFSGILFSEQ